MEKLTSEQLKQEQEKTLASPRMPSGLLAAPLFVTMDLLYGRQGTLSKFKVLEIIARVPYQAWENVAYVALTHTHANLALARRIVDRVHESRLQQDNEQWHLLILEGLLLFPLQLFGGQSFHRRMGSFLCHPSFVSRLYFQF